MITRSFKLVGTTQSHTQPGLGNACQPKPSGNSPLAAAQPPTRATGGVTTSAPAESLCAIPSPAISPITIHPKTATPEPAPGAPSLQTATAYTTWPATS